MTGKELIEELQKLSPEQLEATVYSEGCDCTGVAAGISCFPPDAKWDPDNPSGRIELQRK